MNLRYYLGVILTIPLLPIMYVQGKSIRAKVPDLPEATGPQGTVKANPSHKRLILTMGESTIAGVGVTTHEEGFTGSLARELAQKLDATIEWKVYAKSGYTAKQVRDILLPSIVETNVDLIVIGLGGNDSFTLNTPQRWSKHIRRLIQDTQKRFPDTPIAFTNMPPIKEFPAFTPLIKWVMGNLVEILGEEVEKMVAEFDQVYYKAEKITLKDWIERLEIEADPAEFFSDGVHPSKITYQAWGKDFAQFLCEIPTIKESIAISP